MKQIHRLQTSGTLVLALVAASLLLLTATTTPAAAKPKWEVSLTITISGGQQNKPQAARQFETQLLQELNRSARTKTVAELTQLAQKRLETFEADPANRLALRGTEAPQRAGVQTTFELKITIKSGAKLSSADARFLSSLERKLAVDLERGKLTQDTLPAAAEKAMNEYSAQQTDGPQWHKDKPAVVFSIGLKIKF